MRFLALLTAIGLSLTVANSGMAQPRGGPKGPPNPGPGPGSPPDIRKLQAELDKLQEAIKDVESQLKKAKAAPREEERRESGSGSGFGSMGRGPGGFGGWGGSSRGSGGFGPPGFTPPMSRSSDSGVEKRLDKIEKDLAELKQMLRNQPRR